MGSSRGAHVLWDSATDERRIGASPQPCQAQRRSRRGPLGAQRTENGLTEPCGKGRQRRAFTPLPSHFPPRRTVTRQHAESVWGTGGPEFKSRRPDEEKPRSGEAFLLGAGSVVTTETLKSQREVSGPSSSRAPRPPSRSRLRASAPKRPT
jgi:hypothetical protein